VSGLGLCLIVDTSSWYILGHASFFSIGGLVKGRQSRSQIASWVVVCDTDLGENLIVLSLSLSHGWINCISRGHSIFDGVNIDVSEWLLKVSSPRGNPI
jgi:hypothetical protein